MTSTPETGAPRAELRFSYPADDALHITLGGAWTLKGGLPSTADVEEQIATHAKIRQIRFDARDIGDWDTALLTFLTRIIKQGKEHGIAVVHDGLPEGVHKLLDLAAAVPPKEDTGRHGEQPAFLTRVGEFAITKWRAGPEMLQFVGEVILSFGRLLRGRAQFRRSDLVLIVEDVGPQSLPIVSLISFLFGLIVAYMGAVQLAQFGAQIFIADLVSIGMVREMGALMTGIIMAGRTGASFAAQLGTMQVNEEIDALRTLSIPPMDFLVLPRMLALILIMPLLTLYSDIVGILAGMFVAVTTFDIGAFEYYHQTVRALDLRHIAVGISKGTVYGILIAIAGCLRGMQCGRSAQAVGEATTSAVVTGILFIVIAASLLTILFQELGI